MKIIYLYNQLGAGPLMISSLLINSFTVEDDVYVVANNIIKISNKGKNILILKSHNNLLVRLLFRLIIEIFVIPFVAWKYKAKSLLAFGNFNLIPFPIKKKVLIHHPYLVDDLALSKLPIKAYTVEKLKRFYFKLQVRLFKNNQYIAQTETFKKNLKSKFNLNNVELIPNPITDKINFPSDESFKRILKEKSNSLSELKLLYVSRYYPHKNHQFLIDLAKKLGQSDFKISILITVDINTLPSNLRNEINQSSVLTNIGEIEQQHLNEVYRENHLCIFPSLTETFGNGLIEAAKFGLPTIAFDLPYIKDVLGENVTYIDSVESCITHIKLLMNDKSLYEMQSKNIYHYSSRFIDVDSWKSLLLKE
jgi:glycosyltransferase involved in cell wall biosynthesis